MAAMPNDQPKRRRWAVRIAVALVLLPVLYFAGTGPVVAAYSEGWAPRTLAKAYLAPADWLWQHGPNWVRAPLKSYQVWWVDQFRV
jgi:hypothetical protein